MAYFILERDAVSPRRLCNNLFRRPTAECVSYAPARHKPTVGWQPIGLPHPAALFALAQWGVRATLRLHSSCSNYCSSVSVCTSPSPPTSF